MKPTRLAIGIIAVSTLLAAEPICTRILLPAIHHHYSKARVAEFTAYNKKHHISPKAKEILAELDLICTEMKTQDVDQVGFLMSAEPPQWTDVDVSVPVDNLIPDTPQTASVVPLQLPTLITQPAIAPAEAPEPTSLVLLGTGLLILAYQTIQRKKQCT